LGLALLSGKGKSRLGCFPAERERDDQQAGRKREGEKFLFFFFSALTEFCKALFKRI
jgi:hypothetical protein